MAEGKYICTILQAIQNNIINLYFCLKQDGFLASHNESIPNIVNATDQKKYEDNLAKVEVYFETFEYERIIEVPSYRVGYVEILNCLIIFT